MVLKHLKSHGTEWFSEFENRYVMVKTEPSPFKVTKRDWFNLRGVVGPQKVTFSNVHVLVNYF